MSGFIAVFWNSILSVFLLTAIAGLYTHFVGPLPTWFPTMGSSNPGGSGSPGGGMPLGMSLFLCLFLIPFVLIGLVMIGAFLMYVAGEVQVRIEGAAGLVRTAVGPVGWTRRFDASSVRRVIIGRSRWAQQGAPTAVIEIESARTIRFGSSLTDERRRWLAGVLRMLLLPDSRERV